MRTPDPARRQERTARILEAARELLITHGFRGTTIADLCASAGMSPGHLYHYFASKEAIIHALADRALVQAQERMARLRQAPAIIPALIAELQELLSDRTRHRLVLEILSEASRNAALARMLQAKTGQLRRLLAECLVAAQERGELTPDLEPEEAAILLMCLIDGVRALSIRDPGLAGTAATSMLPTLVARLLPAPRHK